MAQQTPTEQKDQHLRYVYDSEKQHMVVNTNANVFSLIEQAFRRHLFFGKLNLSCDVIVANNCSHQVIVFE